MDIFFEIHSDIPREGPGLNESTQKAFEMIKDFLPEKPEILDIGCGPGMQTLELARHTEGHIIATDVHEPFLERLKAQVEELGLQGRIDVEKRSMMHLDFEEDSFDVLWAEGCIFIMTFAKGIEAWKKYLKTGGYLVVSEACWLRNDPPEEIRKFWEAAYPSMTSVSGNIRTIEETGYVPVGHLLLPEEGWWEYYYNPLVERIARLKEKYKASPEALKIIAGTEQEIELYRKYSAYYGYVFYIMKKI